MSAHELDMPQVRLRAPGGLALRHGKLQGCRGAGAGGGVAGPGAVMPQWPRLVTLY